MKDDFNLCNRRAWGKKVIHLAGVFVLTVLAGCGTTPRVAVLAPVGPDAVAPMETGQMGALQVYTAQAPSDTDVNFEEFFAGDDIAGAPFSGRTRPYGLHRVHRERAGLQARPKRPRSG